MQPTERRLLAQLPRNVWVMTATSFLTDISSEMIFNLLPLFLANVLGAKTGIIGMIEGLAETTASLLKIFSGWFADRIGRQKWLTVGGYSISAISKPLLYFVTAWGGVLAVRLSDRLGKGIRTAPRDALIAGSIGENHRGLAFGVHRAGDTAGALLGLLIALVVVWAAQSDAVGLERDTFQTLVLISLIPAVLAVLVLVIGARDVRVERSAAKLPSFSLAGFDAAFRRFMVVIVLFTLGNSADAFLILRAQERGLSVIGVLAMLATFNLVYTVTAGPAGVLSDRLGRRRLLLGGWMVYGMIYLGFALASAPWQIWLLYGCYGIYYGMVEGTAKAFIADIVPSGQRGTAYGVYSAAVGLTALPASVIAGVLWQGVGSWEGLGAGAPFFFGAALALAAAGLFGVWVPHLKTDSVI